MKTPEEIKEQIITTERFKELTGIDPIQDDLERANCKSAGIFNHICCGWCSKHNKPAWWCLCSVNKYNKKIKENNESANKPQNERP